MKWSNTPIKTLKERPASASIESHSLLLRAGYVHPTCAGIFTYAPFMVRVLQKLEKMIRTHLNQADLTEIYMPMVQPRELWEETGRWESFSEILQTMKNRSEQEFCLGPTHEEVVTRYVGDQVKSYRDLPFAVYQIQTKYRDEYRPRFGLLRAREFSMKDAYSFDLNTTASIEFFKKMEQIYHNIFSELEVDYCVVEADSGAIGGSHSKEFHIIAKNGEDTLYVSKDKKEAYNKEIIEKKQVDIKNFQEYKGIEVAHIFHLGSTYSKKMKAEYLDKNGKKIPMEMGCYGIGLSRTIQAIIEQKHDSSGMIWPRSLCPFHIHITALSYTSSSLVKEKSLEIYNNLFNLGLDVFLDDRDETPGVKFKDADLLGSPVRITIGEKDLKEGKVEWLCRGTGEKTSYSIDQVETAVKKYFRL